MARRAVRAVLEDWLLMPYRPAVRSWHFLTNKLPIRRGMPGSPPGMCTQIGTYVRGMPWLDIPGRVCPDVS
jgi:hypothetical protein